MTSDSPQPTRPVRVRTAFTDKRKALDHYQELRRAGRVARAVVIAEGHDGAVTILGQMLKPIEIAQLLLVAADAVADIEAKRNEPRREPHEEPERRGVHNQGRPREKEVTIAKDGTLVPPPGENLISCGECNHPRWHIFHHNDDDTTSRYACAHCGNEVKQIAVYHAEGQA